MSPAVLDTRRVFAGHAAVAVANVLSHAKRPTRPPTCDRAMESRAVIEQAKGMIMARDRCTAEEAYDILNRISQQQT